MKSKVKDEGVHLLYMQVKYIGDTLVTTAPDQTIKTFRSSHMKVLHIYSFPLSLFDFLVHLSAFSEGLQGWTKMNGSAVNRYVSRKISPSLSTDVCTICLKLTLPINTTTL